MLRHARPALLSALLPLLLAASAGATDREFPAKPVVTPGPTAINGMPLIFADDFESGTAERWEPTDDKAWRVVKQGDNHVYSLVLKKSDFNPPVRSPFNRSLIRDLDVGSFVLDVQLQSTDKDYGHRDLCLFFGYQDDEHLYYVHLGKKTDDHANQIFIVNGEPRRKISTQTTEGTDWDDNWHHARIVRDVETGTIDVYFDDMTTPVMRAVDNTFTNGRVGVGSFDDTGNFDDVRVYAGSAAGVSQSGIRQFDNRGPILRVLGRVRSRLGERPRLLQQR